MMSFHLDRPAQPPTITESLPVQLATVEHYQLTNDAPWDEPFDAELL
jgi:hypothetical protein